MRQPMLVCWFEKKTLTSKKACANSHIEEHKTVQELGVAVPRVK